MDLSPSKSLIVVKLIVGKLGLREPAGFAEDSKIA